MKTKNAQNTSKVESKNETSESYKKVSLPVKTEILGIGVTNDTKENILKYIVNSIKNSRENYYIVTPNPEMIVASQKNSDFKQALNGAKIALNDGVGVTLAGQLLDKPLKERFTGVAIVEDLCKEVSVWPITVGFLGGGPKVAELTAECLRSRYPNLKVVFVAQEWQDEVISNRELGIGDKNKNENDKRYTINNEQKHIDILFVAFGFPKQELWMQNHLGKIPVRVMVGVGGTFDYLSGKVPRAPKFVRSVGFEWLFRLFIQPWRIKRQLALPLFVLLLAKEKFFHKSKSN